MYRVLKQLQTGEFLDVAFRAQLEQALQLVEALNTEWPGEYLVRDPQGNDVSSFEVTRALAWNEAHQLPS
jgi:hypothetical protein